MDETPLKQIPVFAILIHPERVAVQMILTTHQNSEDFAKGLLGSYNIQSRHNLFRVNELLWQSHAPPRPKKRS
jgi:hypothetical protein